MSQLIFKIGEESRPTVPATKEEYDTSPYRDALDAAKKAVDEILESKVSDEGIPANNIVAFLGDRGSGKTSCMLSMRRGLQKDNPYGWTAPKKRINFLKLIDPSFFDSHHNILEIVIGELYHTAKATIDKEHKSSTKDGRTLHNDLMNSFRKVKRALHFIGSMPEKDLMEEYDQLQGLSDGMNLVMFLKDLIDLYLRLYNDEVLIISIDDIDVNLKEAYVMMEQIRKYLILPNVVVLMAAKLQQLNEAITLYYHRNVLQGSEYKDNQRLLPELPTIAERYIDKFLPIPRRIFMPTLDVMASSSLQIILPDQTTVKYETVEFGVLSLIYKKSGYLFFNYENSPSQIIPRNLRELKMLVSMLASMDDRENDKDIKAKNQKRFKDYFYSQWTQNMTEAMQNVADRIVTLNDMSRLNRSIVTILNDFFDLSKDLANEDLNTLRGVDKLEIAGRNRIMEICDPRTAAANISIGDVLFVVNWLKNRYRHLEVGKLMFFISTHYSILLSELYERMTDSLYQSPDKVTNTQQLPKLKTNHDLKIADYLRIVGHSFFVLTGGKFLPNTLSGSSREITVINGATLHNEIRKAIKLIQAKDPSIKQKSWIQKLNLLEFFVLSTSRRIFTEEYYDVSETDNWRTNSTIYLFQLIPQYARNILFDATSPFINLIEPALAYNRWAEGFFESAKEVEGSMIHKLLNHYQIDKSNARYIISQIAIRNTEILADLEAWLESKKTTLNGSDIDILTKFYYQ